MNKKIIAPFVICMLTIIAAVSTCMSGGKIKLDWEKVETNNHTNDSIELKIYVENSGSMDAYMCPGSNLKDAVFDYVSDLKKYAKDCSLYYINSQTIPYKGDLQSFIKDLTPASFSKAGGNRTNTDLRDIFNRILTEQTANTVTVFVSDCILDIPENAIDFFGNCQVSIKSAFNDALSRNPNLGVVIMKLQSKFEGYWYCGKNSEKLSNVNRPYYIWVIGDKEYIADLNKKVPVSDIIGGIKEYCAFSGKSPIAFDIEKNIYVVNRTKKIQVQILIDLSKSLQSELIIKNVGQYKSSNPAQTIITSVEQITTSNSPYSHVIELEISNPETIKNETVTFTYPYLASWVETSNDSTGKNVTENIDKTTGISSLIRGVAEAYKSATEFGSITFNLKNK